MKRVLLLSFLIASACSTGRVQTTMSAPQSAPLPRPSHVVLTDFTVSPDAVTVDSGVRSRLTRAMNGEADSTVQTKAAADAQSALTETLSARLAAYGLPVERLPASVAPPPNTLLVQGQITSIDEGNQTRRTLIGLGAGKSSLRANAQLYYVDDPSSPRFLQSFAGDADSGHMPGAAETMGAGAAADRLATSAAMTAATHAGAEAHRTGDAANADKVAKALAHQIGIYAVSQGWIPATAVQ